MLCSLSDLLHAFGGLWTRADETSGLQRMIELA
jgi:hypothetical protein